MAANSIGDDWFHPDTNEIPNEWFVALIGAEKRALSARKSPPPSRSAHRLLHLLRMHQDATAKLRRRARCMRHTKNYTAVPADTSTSSSGGAPSATVTGVGGDSSSSGSSR